MIKKTKQQITKQGGFVGKSWLGLYQHKAEEEN
jgi:hypothetical protein